MEVDWATVHKLKNIKGLPLSSESRREPGGEFFLAAQKESIPAFGSDFGFHCRTVRVYFFQVWSSCYRSHRKLIQEAGAADLSHRATSECDGMSFCDFIKSTKHLVRERLQKVFEVNFWHTREITHCTCIKPVGLEDMTDVHKHLLHSFQAEM